MSVADGQPILGLSVRRNQRIANAAFIVKAVNSFDSLVNALKVISYDAKISAWLGENDPKALVQVRQAIANATK